MKGIMCVVPTLFAAYPFDDPQPTKTAKFSGMQLAGINGAVCQLFKGSTRLYSKDTPNYKLFRLGTPHDTVNLSEVMLAMASGLMCGLTPGVLIRDRGLRRNSSMTVLAKILSRASKSKAGPHG